MNRLLPVTAAVTILLAVLFWACSKTSSSDISQSDKPAQTTKTTKNHLGAKFHIFYASWDEWGRSSRNCDGWGLCNFQSCALCCEEGGVIVNCPTSARVPNSGTISIDEDTKEGNLEIALDPQIDIQNEAIVNQSTFYVDDDITTEDGGFTLHQGEYQFQDNIGSHGGYSLSITQN